MPLSIASLNSGSNANCYYVGNEDDAILVDAGLAYKETILRMEGLGLDPKRLKAVFISHEHTDHISGVTQLHRKLNLPVYITEKTRLNTALRFRDDLIRPFIANAAIQIGSLHVLPFTKFHDAADPHSFMVYDNEVTIGILTDIGHACEEVINCFKQCDAVFLESNYCEEMLANGSYPAQLKKRISGKSGHLSNRQALELFVKHKSERLQLVLLAHLSQNNNTPEKALSEFRD
ncbi:MAG TPA: MBL fold metallo-hydrolase, partial [Chitinophagales bacterium]|nr:MBL fold metallo-hydrolase [Chitinophagales bacterium]